MYHIEAKIGPPANPAKSWHHGQKQHTWQVIAGPLLFVMKISGLYHENIQSIGIVLVSDLGGKKRKYIRARLLMFYQVFVVFILWLNLIRFITSFTLNLTNEGLIFYDHIAYGTWLFQVAANSSVLFWVCWNTDSLPLFQKHWNSHFQGNLEPPVDGSHKVLRHGTVFAAVCAVLGCLMTMINISTFSVLVFTFGTDSAFALPICGPFSSEMFCALALAIPYSTTPAWVFPLLLFSLMCHIISDQFSQLNTEFVSSLSENSSIDSALLNSFRRRHAILCHSVELADNVLSPFAAFTYITNIPIVIFILYQLSYQDDIFYIGVSIFWILCTMISISVLSYFAVKVHEKVILN